MVLMRLSRVVGAVVVAVALTAVAPAAAASAAGPGAILLIGGALSDDNAEIYGEFVRLAGGPQARIGVLSASSAVPHSSANAVVKALKKHGAGAATWIPVSEKKAGSGEDPANAALAAGMTAFFFTGGDQFRYVQTMIRPDGTDGAVLAAVRQRFDAGAPVAGTSAGMQIFAGPDMITGGLSYFGVRDGTQPGYFDTEEIVGYWPAGGFGFFTAGLVDTHFDARGRHGRSIRLAADAGHDRVFGVGEDTALLATGSSMRVLGVNGVSLLDLRDAQVTGDWAITGVRWSYLVAGDVYRADTWQIVPANAPVAPQQRPAGPPSTDIFGSYSLLDSALDLATAGQSAQTTGSTAESPAFVVTLAKGSAFQAYPRSFSELSLAIS
jgi:cyanophycinase